MAQDTYIIKFQVVNGESVVSAIDRVGKKATEVERTLSFFRKALVAFSAVRAASGLVEFVDAAQRIDNRLKSATNSTEEFARAQQFVRDISRETRTDMEANAQVYSRLLRSTEGLKFTTSDLEQTMESLSLAIQVGGSTSQEARNAMIQFSQALASGALRGDELRSVSEQLPIIANAIGKEFGVAGGALISFAKANPGILETEKVIRGVQKALPALRTEFAKITPTLGSAFQVLHDQFIILISDVNSATGIVGGLARIVLFLADNLQILIETTAILLALWATNRIITFAASLAQSGNIVLRYALQLRIAAAAQYAFNLAVASNPYLLIATAIVALIGALILLYTHFEPVRVVVALLGQGIAMLISWLGQVAAIVGGYLVPALNVFYAALAVLVPIAQAFIQVIVAIALGFWEVIKPGPGVIAFFQQLFASTSLLAPVIEFLARLFAITLYTALFAVLTVLTMLVRLFALVGVVSQETANAVNAQYAAYVGLASGVLGLTKLEEQELPIKFDLNTVTEEMEKNYRKLADSVLKSANNTKTDTRATLENLVAKRELNKELKDELKWRDMVTGRTEAGWAALTKDANAARTAASVHRDLASAYTQVGTSANGAVSGVSSLTGAVNSSASAAEAAASSYSRMASAASSAGSAASNASSNAGTGADFSGSYGASGVTVGRPQSTAAEKAVAQDVQSMALRLQQSGQLSQKKFEEYMEVTQTVLDGHPTTIPFARYPDYLYDWQADLRKQIARADAQQNSPSVPTMPNTPNTPSTTPNTDYQTYWPWQQTVGFATGGRFRIPGSIGSTDNVMAALRLSPGEEVEIRSAKDRNKRNEEDLTEDAVQPILVNFYITAQDVDSFRRNQAQIEADIASAVNRANYRRNRR